MVVCSLPLKGEGWGGGHCQCVKRLRIDPLPICAVAQIDLPFSRGGEKRPTQSNKLDTDSSAAVRLIASAIRPAIDSVRILLALRTASVGWIESVMTSSFSREEVIRVTAPPDSTPWVI